MKYIFGRTEKSEHHYWFLDIQVSLSTKFKFKLNISTFWTKFTQKSISCGKWKKWTQPLHSIRINLSTKFNFKSLWVLGPNLPERVNLVENETGNITIAFYIAKLVWVPKLSLNKQFGNCRKWKQWTSPLNSTNWN